jgi:hypothetical protein
MKQLDQETAFAHDVANLINNIVTQGYKCTLGQVTKHSAKQMTTFKNDIIVIDFALYSSDDEYLRDRKSHEQFGSFWESLGSHNVWGAHVESKYGGKREDLYNHFYRKLE